MNGGFEDLVVTSAQEFRSGGTSFGGWSVGGGSIDHTASFWQAAEANQSVDLDGASYMLSFAMAGNPFGVDAKRMQVNWGGAERLLI